MWKKYKNIRKITIVHLTNTVMFGTNTVIFETKIVIFANIIYNLKKNLN